jgi:hypothetical protein
MIELRRNARLVLEAPIHPFRIQQLGKERLDRDLAVERQVVGQEHDRHAAAPDLTGDVVFADRRRSQRRQDAIDMRSVRSRVLRCGRRVFRVEPRAAESAIPICSGRGTATGGAPNFRGC